MAKTFNLLPVAGSKNRVFVQPLEYAKERQSEGGLVIPGTAEDNRLPMGIVLNVSGKDENGVEPTVKIGDTVLYNRFITTVEEHDYVQFISMKEGDIIAIIKK